MATSSSEPPPKHVKLRYRALAYVRRFGRHRQPPRPRATSRRSFADTGGARAPIQVDSNQRRFSDSGGARPVVRLASKRGFADSSGARSVVRSTGKRGFADSGGARPVVRIGSRRSFADSGGARPAIRIGRRKSSADSTGSNEGSAAPGEIKVKTRSRRSSRARNKVRKARDGRNKRRHRFLASLHDHGGHRFRLFCGCCVEQDAFDPGETPSFRWGVGFDDSYYHTSSYLHLTKGTRFRLELCGLHVTGNRDPLRPDVSTVGARAASFDSGFGFTCASPVACPPPLGLAPARTLPTTLELRSRDGTGSGKFTLESGKSGFSSTGFKRKTPSSASYPSYTPTTPPSPFLNDFLPVDTFNNTRARSRVSVGCNGWFLRDDDPAIVGWYRRRSSGEVQPPPIITHLSQVAETTRESDDRESPKRYKKSPLASGATSGVSSSPSPPSPTRIASPKPPLAPRAKSKASSPASSRGSRVSIVLLSQDGSVSSSSGGHGWLANSGIALVPLPTSPLTGTTRLSYMITPPPPFVSSQNSYRSSLASQEYDSALLWQGESGLGEENHDYGPPTKRRRSTGSSSNSSGGFGFGNLPRASMDEVEERESLQIEHSLSARQRTSFTARLSASLRLTRSHSPQSMKKALSPATRRRKSRRSRSHSASRGRRMLHISSRASASKSVSPHSTPANIASSRPSIVFIDCPP